MWLLYRRKKARIKEYDTKRKELIDRAFADGTLKELGQRLEVLNKEYEDCVFGTKWAGENLLFFLLLSLYYVKIRKHFSTLKC